MRKEIFQDNKARWEVLEQISSLQSKIVWAVLAVAAAVVLIYLLK